MRPGLQCHQSISERTYQGLYSWKSSVCKVNSAADNTEPSGLFCSDRSDSDTVCRVSIDSDPPFGKAESTGSAESFTFSLSSLWPTGETRTTFWVHLKSQQTRSLALLLNKQGDTCITHASPPHLTCKCTKVGLQSHVLCDVVSQRGSSQLKLVPPDCSFQGWLRIYIHLQWAWAFKDPRRLSASDIQQTTMWFVFEKWMHFMDILISFLFVRSKWQSTC